MIKFIEFMNNQTVYELKKKLVYKKINDYFIKDVTLKRNLEWDFVNKTPFELFHQFSESHLDELASLLTNNPLQFKDVIKNLDSITEFVLFQPYNIVFTKIMSDTNSLKIMLDNVSLEHNINSNLDNTRAYYQSIFKSCITSFVEYFS